MAETYVVKPDLSRYIGGDFDFLANAVDEMELALRVEYGKRYAGKTSACAEIHNARAFAQVAEKSRYGQRMKHMARVEVAGVGARNDVDF